MQKPYFSVLKNGFGLLARSAYWAENTVISTCFSSAFLFGRANFKLIEKQEKL